MFALVNPRVNCLALRALASVGKLDLGRLCEIGAASLDLAIALGLRARTRAALGTRALDRLTLPLGRRFTSA
jgi:hypothetical protein